MAEENDIHNSFPELQNSPSIDATDIECMQKISAILKEYEKENRFGLNLLHKHFDVDSDEELVEITDTSERTMTKKPMKKKEVEKLDPNGIDIKTTSWYLGSDFPIELGKCRTLWHVEQ